MALLEPIRAIPNLKSAVVFIHGYLGGVDATWDRLPFMLAADRSLDSWNILSFGYGSSLLPGTPGIWSADADLPKLSQLLFTELQIPPLVECKEVALVAHSMGGLIVQRALLNMPDMLTKVKHVLLFGTPSAGVGKANFMRRLLGPLAGPQVRNMERESDFIRTLRNDWSSQFGDNPPFHFLTVAGEKDNFVPADSSLEPFPQRFRRVVAGDHLSMIKPLRADADVVRLLASVLAQTVEPPGPLSPLRLAAEVGASDPIGLALARELASGHKTANDEAQIVDAALALARIDEREAAIRLLKSYQQLGTDVKGTLAGRIKRRWLQDGSEADAYWALGLYTTALDTARRAPLTREHIAQVFYHAINVAFLKLLAFDDAEEARSMAALALEYANKLNPADEWSMATQAEAWLHLGNDTEALSLYRRTVELSSAKWKLASTGQQALQIAAKLNKRVLLEQLRNIFDPPPVSSLAASR